MERLTSARCNGIKNGYWSTAKKDELIQRLGRYEDTGFEPEEIKRVSHAQWLEDEDNELDPPAYYYRCSKCGAIADRKYPYCHCGANMKEV